MEKQKMRLTGRTAYIVTSDQITPVQIQAVGEKQILVRSYSTGAITQHARDQIYLSLSRAVSVLTESDEKTKPTPVCK